MIDEETRDKIVAAVGGVSGLRPATPLGAGDPAWWPWDTRRYAVDLGPTTVEVRVIAAALPLPPLLNLAAEAVRGVLHGTRWENAAVRLVVTELDAAAFADDQGG
ncbi:hypothetical protein IU443_04905 [Nocardia farcinica]|uniref:hypothetical protein n=2 Tax=Nocardiaceae TaxID=85025 RepID=UPI000A38C6B8|nr:MULTISPECIES: hypothetical protein [Nocardia]MBA4855530.1 hypothetical protein [Nocardia farcinica]MBC9818131.1 hypothetical protein [Nocardia farcinica]MBF6067826.1 hypothetical protein [Nocardia farcinica]MBF6184617.1 hypothetical protein [Nocardia farcinica]MBF6231047.1 hypothetical protein [Nocardia farcinica]